MLSTRLSLHIWPPTDYEYSTAPSGCPGAGRRLPEPGDWRSAHTATRCAHSSRWSRCPPGIAAGYRGTRHFPPTAAKRLAAPGPAPRLVLLSTPPANARRDAVARSADSAGTDPAPDVKTPKSSPASTWPGRTPPDPAPHPRPRWGRWRSGWQWRSGG